MEEKRKKDDYIKITDLTSKGSTMDHMSVKDAAEFLQIDWENARTHSGKDCHTKFLPGQIVGK